MSELFLPTSAEVGPWLYSIEYSQAFIEEGEEKENTKLDGFTDIAHQRIIIKPGLGIDYTATVIWHELKHVIMWQQGFRWSDTKEEDLIVRTAAFELDTLRRNTRLARLLVP